MPLACSEIRPTSTLPSIAKPTEKRLDNAHPPPSEGLLKETALSPTDIALLNDEESTILVFLSPPPSSSSSFASLGAASTSSDRLFHGPASSFFFASPIASF